MLLQLSFALQLLTFIAMLLDPNNNRDGNNSLRASLSNVVSSGLLPSHAEVGPQLGKQLFETLATCAMQFRGYLHQVQESQVKSLPYQQVSDS